MMRRRPYKFFRSNTAADNQLEKAADYLRFIPAIVALFFLSNPATAAEVYLSSYDASNGYAAWSGGIQQGGFHGIRFSVTEDVHVTGLSAYMGGSGDFFAAIVDVGSPTGLPSLITPEEVSSGALAYSTSTFFDTGGVDSPSVHEVAFDTVLSSGTYVAFFGATGELGQENSGYIPLAAQPESSNIALNDYVIKSWTSWIEAPSEPVSIQILTTTVPIPAAVWLFGSALAGLGWFRRRQTA
jgi:hypothetical protein